MKPADYIAGVKATEPNPDQYDEITKRMSYEDLTLARVLLNRMAHLGNQLGALKKKIFYDDKRPKVLDEVRNAKSEHGYLLEHFSANYHTVRNASSRIRLFHGILGKGDEIGELASAFGFFLKTGRLDEINLKEELGDDAWYTGVIVDDLGLTFESVWHTNRLKLIGTNDAKGRYKDGFSQGDAINRNLEQERKLLESN